jgi:hypothetical protein
MGSLITFASEGSFYPPQWFKEKWEPFVSFSPELNCKSPRKGWSDFELDIQRAMNEAWTEGLEPQIIIVFLHDCGGVARAHIRPDEIRYSEPVSWHEVSTPYDHTPWDSCRQLPWKERAIRAKPLLKNHEDGHKLSNFFSPSSAGAPADGL